MDGNDEETHGETFRGAGIVLYMTRRRDGRWETHFVLGQEDFYPQWNQSGCWSGFEGGRKPGEGVEDTAAREFVEETMGTIAINGRSGASDIARMLRERQYAVRIDVTRGSGEEGHATRRHVVFLVRVPWDEDIASEFSATRGALAALAVRCAARDTAAARGTERGTERCAAEAAERTRDVAEALSSLPAPVLLHPAVIQPDDPAAVRVHPDYMEKRDVRLVSLAYLRSLITCRKQRYGRAHRGRLKLRYIFIPTLRAIIDIFDHEALGPVEEGGAVE